MMFPSTPQYPTNQEYAAVPRLLLWDFYDWYMRENTSETDRLAFFAYVAELDRQRAARRRRPSAFERVVQRQEKAG